MDAHFRIAPGYSTLTSGGQADLVCNFKRDIPPPRLQAPLTPIKKEAVATYIAEPVQSTYQNGNRTTPHFKTFTTNDFTGLARDELIMDINSVQSNLNTRTRTACREDHPFFHVPKYFAIYILGYTRQIDHPRTSSM